MSKIDTKSDNPNILPAKTPIWERVTYRTKTRIKKRDLVLAPNLLVHRPTGEVYNSDSAATVRSKHALLCIANPAINTFNALGTVAVRLGQATFHAAQGRGGLALRCLQQAACAPVMLGVLQGCAVMGLACPYTARRWYARAEGQLLFRLAPCFAPLAYRGQAIDAAALVRKDLDQHLFQANVGGSRW